MFRISSVSLILLVALLPVLAIGCTGCADNPPPPPVPDDTAQSDAEFDRRLLTAVKAFRFVAGDTSAEEASATAFLTKHADRAVPRLIEWLGSDPGLTLGLRHSLELEGAAGAHIAIEVLREIRAPEALRHLVKLVVSRRQAPEARIAAELLTQYGQAGMDAIRRMMELNPQLAPSLRKLCQEFPRRVQLDYWLRFVADDNEQLRTGARQWLKILIPSGEVVEREMILSLWRRFGELGGSDVAKSAQVAIVERLRLWRPTAGDDPWYLPAMTDALRRCTDFTEVMNPLLLLMSGIRRDGFLTRLKEFHKQNAPPDGDSNSHPQWIGFKRIDQLCRQVDDRFAMFRSGGSMRPDEVRDSETDEAVPYGPDRNDETVTLADGRQIPAASLLPGEPLADPPGEAARNDEAVLESLMDATEDWNDGFPTWTHAAAFMEAALGQPATVDDAWRYPCEQWPELAAHLVTVSPLVLALAACGQPALDGLGTLDADTDWRLRCGRRLVRALVGKPITTLPSTAGSAFDMANAITATTMSTGSELLVSGHDWLTTDATRLPVAARPGRLTRDVGHLLAVAWGWNRVHQPESVATTVTSESWLTRATALSAGDAAVLDAAWILADTDPTLREPLRAILSRVSGELLTAIAARVRWARHGWSYPLIVAMVERADATPPLALLDALSRFTDHADRTPVFGKLAAHPDAGVRARALAELPADETWTDTLVGALDDASPDVAAAAASKLLAAGSDSPHAQRAAARLHETAPGKLLEAFLPVLPVNEAFRYLENGFATTSLHVALLTGIHGWVDVLLVHPAPEVSSRLHGLLAAHVLNRRWASPYERSVLLEEALRLDSEASRSLLADAIRSNDRELVERAVRNLVLRDTINAAEAEALAGVLHPDWRAESEEWKRIMFGQIVARIRRTPGILEHKVVVDALLAWLTHPDKQNGLVPLAVGALVRYMTPPMPRVVRAVATAYFDQRLGEQLSAEIAGYLGVAAAGNIDTPEHEPAVHVLVDAMLTGVADAAVSMPEAHALALYRQTPTVRDVMRRYYWGPGTTPTYDVAGRILHFARHRLVMDPTWLEFAMPPAARYTEGGTNSLPGAPPIQDRDRMEKHIVVPLVALTIPVGLPVPEEYLGDDEKIDQWVLANFSRHSQWEAWWKENRDRVLAAAEASYRDSMRQAREQRKQNERDQQNGGRD